MNKMPVIVFDPICQKPFEEVQFMYARASSIISSLWDVDDKSTSILMKILFQLAKKGMIKSDVTSKAQIILKKIPQYKYPCYYTSMVMIGDWI